MYRSVLFRLSRCFRTMRSLETTLRDFVFIKAQKVSNLVEQRDADLLDQFVAIAGYTRQVSTKQDDAGWNLTPRLIRALLHDRMPAEIAEDFQRRRGRMVLEKDVQRWDFIEDDSDIGEQLLEP